MIKYTNLWVQVTIIHFNIKVKTGTIYKKQLRRNFNNGKYKEIRTYLANTDWNNAKEQDGNIMLDLFKV